MNALSDKNKIETKPNLSLEEMLADKEKAIQLIQEELTKVFSKISRKMESLTTIQEKESIQKNNIKINYNLGTEEIIILKYDENWKGYAKFTKEMNGFYCKTRDRTFSMRTFAKKYIDNEIKPTDNDILDMYKTFQETNKMLRTEIILQKENLKQTLEKVEEYKRKSN